MGYAKQCDRCKGLYLESNEDIKIKDGYGNWVVGIRVYRDWLRQNLQDVCDECIKELLGLYLKEVQKIDEDRV